MTNTKSNATWQHYMRKGKLWWDCWATDSIILFLHMPAPESLLCMWVLLGMIFERYDHLCVFTIFLVLSVIFNFTCFYLLLVCLCLLYNFWVKLIFINMTDLLNNCNTTYNTYNNMIITDHAIKSYSKMAGTAQLITLW
jgi:hypothetical protein